MAVLITAHVDRAGGWASLRFPYDLATKDAIKAYPGARWDPDTKTWLVPLDLLPIIQRQFRVVVIEKRIESGSSELPFSDRLKPYQVEGAQRMIANAGFLLAFEPRVGKTPTAIAAACSLFQAGAIDLVLVLYPNSVAAVWERELKVWANLDLVRLAGMDPKLVAEINALRAVPYLVVGCHYEILSKRETDLARLVDSRRYAVIADEVHMLSNYKAGRTATARRLAAGDPILIHGDILETSVRVDQSTRAVAHWGLTGTPMRNRPKNLYTVFDFLNPSSMGVKPWKFSIRYCDGHRDDAGHWYDKGSSNPEELRERLSGVWYRVTRKEAAPWLPRAQRHVIACAVSAQNLKKYRRLERAYATTIGRALDAEEPSAQDREAIKQLALATSDALIPTALDRVRLHSERGVKVVVFAHHHESLKAFHAAFVAACEADSKNAGKPAELCLPGPFLAGGWLEPTERRSIIKRWQAAPAGAVLLANGLSSGVGIDLADAEVSVSLEPAWVPADLQQREDRLEDVHLGKGGAPRLHEYLMIPGTITEAMLGVLLKKMRAIEDVVGVDTTGLTEDLRKAGVAGVGLQSTDRETVRAALNSLRDSILSGTENQDEEEPLDLEDWDDEQETTSESAEEIPF